MTTATRAIITALYYAGNVRAAQAVITAVYVASDIPITKAGPFVGLMWMVKHAAAAKALGVDL